jgi:ribosomal protein S18 acetylase RimI-like enzyme
MSITLRNTTANDASDCARIVFDAFGGIARQHNFPLDFPAREMADGFMQAWTAHPKIFGMLAEENGKTLGCNFLDERNSIGGVGPIVVDPAAQGRGIGRLLMLAIVERGRAMRGIRLVQDAFNTASMSLYTSVGFDVREPLALVSGKCTTPPPADARVRSMTEADIAQCNQVCKRAHGFDRGGELADALKMFKPHVLERNGKIVAYASAPWLWVLNHAAADNLRDMQTLLLGVSAIGQESISMLVPTRQAELFRWCIGEGLRVVKPMTLMTMGWYQQPEMPYFPSVLY